ELPSGGARVAAYRDPDHVVTVNKTVKQLHTASRWTRGAPSNRIPEQVSLNLDMPVPMLMDSVEEHAAKEQTNHEPAIGDLSNLDDDDLQPALDDALPDQESSESFGEQEGLMPFETERSSSIFETERSDSIKEEATSKRPVEKHPGEDKKKGERTADTPKAPDE